MRSVTQKSNCEFSSLLVLPRMGKVLNIQDYTVFYILLLGSLRGRIRYANKISRTHVKHLVSVSQPVRRIKEYYLSIFFNSQGIRLIGCLGL